MTRRVSPGWPSTARSWTSTTRRCPRRSGTGRTRHSDTASSAWKASSRRRSAWKRCARPAPTPHAPSSSRRSSRSRASTSASARRSASDRSAIRVSTACTSPACRVNAGCPLPIGPRPSAPEPEETPMARKRESRHEQQHVEMEPRERRGRLGLRGKIMLFLVAALVPLAAVTWYVSARSIRASMTEEFISKGEAIASSLASSGVDLISTRDAASVQSLVDEFARIRGVAYVMVYDPQKKLIAHTFSPSVPAGIIDKNLVPGTVARQQRDVDYQDPARKTLRSIIDIGVPMAAGKLGTVRVGMDRGIIDHAAAASGRQLLVVFDGVAALTLIGGALLARRLTRPITYLVEAAKSVGEGDLSETVVFTSRDEIGELAQTFNHAIVRLRAQVSTEAERDEERRRREDLQENIIRFLDVAMEVSQGDLTKRGEVTSDVLGNVVDAINLMVAEIAAIIADVRVAAMQVSVSANQMTGSTGRMAQGAQEQAREAARVAAAVSALTQLVRQVAESAQSSAAAAREALDAAQRGDAAVRDSLQGMQRIRGEVQAISKKIKSLGDRSME